jgi:hypothetical protein
MISSAPDELPPSIHSSSGSKMETVSTRVSVSTSSSESSASPGRTNKNTESDIANPDYLLMKEGEVASTGHSHVNISPNYEQELRHKESEKTHKEHGNEFMQENLTSGMLTEGVPHIQEDDKQQQLLLTSSNVSHIIIIEKSI